jgi:hypothetical protein
MSYIQRIPEHHRSFNCHIHVCVDSSRTVLGHHRSFILSTLVNQLEGKNTNMYKPAGREQNKHVQVYIGIQNCMANLAIFVRGII